MGKFNYGPLTNTGAKLIDRFGYAATISRKIDGVTTTFAVTIVMTEYQPREKDGALVLETDRKAILSAKGLTITPDPETDRLIENGNSLRIVTVTPTAPAGVPILYELQIRK
jgi:hypothetical protein